MAGLQADQMTATEPEDQHEGTVMTDNATESRNGWGPAAPAEADAAADNEEPRTGEWEDQQAEEVGGDEAAHANKDGRRVYGPEEEYDAASDPGHDEPGDEEKPEEDELEEFGHEPGAPPQAPAVAVDEDNDMEEEEYEEEAEEEFATSQDSAEAPEATKGSQHPQDPLPQEFEQEESEQEQRAGDTSAAAHTGTASTGKKKARNQTQASGQQEGRGASERRRAFDPDVASSGNDQAEAAREGASRHEVAEQAPAHRQSSSEPSSESSGYGSYGAGSLQRSVISSLRKLPVAGKLFGSGPVHDSARSSTPTDDQGIADKPSPQEVEKRLALALRETSIDGFSKIAVGSPKGGVGKSSLAYAMGCAIANHTNIRVCLVDADPEFGATRSLVPRPVPYSIVELARDADELHRLSDIRGYVAQNEQMRLDVVLNPSQMIQKARITDLPAAYERIDEALSRFYDLVIYDMGIGFSHPQIQTVLGLSDELLLVGDSEVVPNDIFGDALSYIQGLNFGLDNATLAISHRLPATDESATTGLIKSEHATRLRRVTEIPYDASFSQLLNRRAFRVDSLSLQTRLGILTTAAASLEGLRSGEATGPRKKG